MSAFSTIFQALISNKDAYTEISQSRKWNKWGMLFVLILGIIYGLIFMAQYREIIYAEFETELFQKYIVPGIVFLTGILMVFLTRLGLTLLLWAASKGFGGAGLLGNLNRTSIYALTPSVLAMPAFITQTAGGSVTTVQLALSIVGLIWMYILLVRVLEGTQAFAKWKAYTGAAAIFIFFLCILYIVTPPAA